MKNDYETALDMMAEIIGQMRRMPEPKDDGLGSETALKEQVRKLVEDKRKLTQNLDHAIDENNDLELTIGRLKAALEKAEDEKAVLQAKADSYDGVSREQATEAVRLKEQVRRYEEQLNMLHEMRQKLEDENYLLDKAVKNLSEQLEDAEAKTKEPTPTACPFCGGRPDVVAINKERWVVTCHSDTCAVNPETEAFGTIEEAVSAWNHRAGGLTCDWR